MDRQTAQIDTYARMGTGEYGGEGSIHPGKPAADGNERGALGIAVAATFTADPVIEPLQFWMQQLSIGAHIELAPYAQLMQQLLDPSSVLSRNVAGVDILLVRLEDWIRYRPAEDSPEERVACLRAAAEELLSGIQTLRRHTSASILVFLAPISSAIEAGPRHELETIQADLARRLASVPRVRCFEHADLSKLYPVQSFEQMRTDRIGHIPYTTEYFVALATLLARLVAKHVKPRHKVIAVDCDNTLWGGVCGEEGPEGIALTPAHLQLQQLLVRQHAAGMLLCLCSKNNPQDVDAVFAAHPQMPLRPEHIVASRVNWDPKPDNLRALARELDLSLDSFIFLDDSPLECAQVQAECPLILTLRLPEDPDDIAHFLEHTWAFDTDEVTEDARRRTQQYRENRARALQLERTGSLRAFLATLELHVEVAAMQAAELTRVAELIQRTSQFNTTGIRRRAAEIERLWRDGSLDCLVVRVRDRFGDYGLVGALLTSREPASIVIDTFVLSCRVLGRGVEHRAINALADRAAEEGRFGIQIRYQASARNVPARDFLEAAFIRFRSDVELDAAGHVASCVFSVPVASAQALMHMPSEDRVDPVEERAPQVVPKESSAAAASSGWHTNAYRLSRVPDIVTAIAAASTRMPQSRQGYSPPRTQTERAVAEIWGELLGVQRVGLHDDFFELGGDSLLAVQATARIGDVLGLEMPLDDFLEHRTVEWLARRLGTAASFGPPISRIDRADDLPLSFAQQRLWFMDQLEGGSLAYHNPICLWIAGELNVPALRAALDSIVERHEVLRTVFPNEGGRPAQRIAARSLLELRVDDLSGLETRQRERDVRRYTSETVTAPFDLGSDTLIRSRLLQLGPAEHVLIIAMHDMISDRWSSGVLLRELLALYEAHQEGRVNPLPELPIQYADYAHWQRIRLAAPEARKQLSHWIGQLRGAPEFLTLPLDRPRPATQSYRGASVRIAFDSDLADGLRALSRRLSATLATTLLAAWSILLSRLAGQQDVVVGVPVANRPRTELEGLIGFFVNTLAIRVRFEDDVAAGDLVRQVGALMIEGFAHQDVQFEQIVEELKPARSLSHSPIFQAMFLMQSTPHRMLEILGLRLIEQELPAHAAKFDLQLSLEESDDGGLQGSLIYASDLFECSTVERWAASFEVILRAIVREPERRVRELPLLDQESRQQIVIGFNATDASFPSALIHELVGRQVQRSPNAVAVIGESESLTYAELDHRSSQVARHLASHGVGPGDLVALCLERSPQLLVGLLGVLKAGAAYMPLDASYPHERLSYMLQDAAPRVLLTQAVLQPLLPSEFVARLLIEDLSAEAEQAGAFGDRRASGKEVSPLAYVIYTSGSTGRPKGVMIEHRSVVNFLTAMLEITRLDASDRLMAVTTLAFDIAGLELYLPLICGASVVIATRASAADPIALSGLIQDRAITVLQATPSTWRMLVEGGWEGSARLTALCGGEALPSDLAARICERVERLWNVYGPTETTIWSTAHAVAVDSMRGAPAAVQPIGRPIANTYVYVLDRCGEPVPIGVVGELYIGGVGVARGYLNRADLTNERFTVDPFRADGSRMYRTGDLARWREDGELEFLGRNDYQVKIHGYRIELGEIEAQLSRHPQVRQAVVLARAEGPGEQRLIAYVIAEDPGSSLPVAELRAHLLGTLPEYMIPSAFVTLAEFPLTSNGKLDRGAFPAPDMDAYATRQFEAPDGDVEQMLAEIWQELLRVEPVGRRDNFFELGGHSLLIMQLMRKLNEAGFSARVRHVFEAPVLADLARVLTRGRPTALDVPPNLIPEECEAITPDMLPLVRLDSAQIARIVESVPGGAGNVQDIYPLAPLQEGILFHHMLRRDGGDPYVVPTLLAVESRERLDGLMAALQSVIDRHDALRTAILWENLPQPVQVVYRRARLQVEKTVLPDKDPTESLQEWLTPERQHLDLRRAPLLRLNIARAPGQSRWYALVQIHHIIGDNTAREGLIAEVVAHLERCTRELPPAAPYRDYVARALAYARRHDVEMFFRLKLGDVDEPTLVYGIADVYGAGAQSRRAHQQIDASLTRRVRAAARRLRVTSATLFHAAWALVVAHTSGREDVVFGSVLVGRLHGSAASQRALGMFINTLPVRLRVADLTARQLVESVQRELAELLEHEEASLALAQRCSRVPGTTPLFNALLNYRHRNAVGEVDWSSAAGVNVLHTNERTNYPVALSVDEGEEGFALTVLTDASIDAQRIIGYVQVALHSLVRALDESSHAPVLSLRALPDAERHRLLVTFNATKAAYPQEQLVHEVFEACARRTPNAVAVLHEGGALTYAELNAQANRLAHHLRERGVSAADYVVLLMQRCLHMVIAQLAVLKCGAAYVPVDPELPDERQAFLIHDCRARHVLATGKTSVQLHDQGLDWIDCTAFDELFARHSSEDLGLRGDAGSAVYVMYTSGSTGQPKGVVVSHRGITRLVINCGYVQLDTSDVIASCSNPAFDAATFEVWAALLNGAELAIVPEQLALDSERFAALLRRYGVTVLWQTTGLFNQHALSHPQLFAGLRYLLFGGDVADPNAVKCVLAEGRPEHLLNMYGPTEATTFSTWYPCLAVAEEAKTLPIGRPIANAHVYILNRFLEPVPLGAVGEIYIGGAGVALGYLNRPELTAERFIDDRFSTQAGARLYRTGDLGRWREDGTIDFMGRSDTQIKLRGFRIELGEIENRLMQHEQVRKAVVHVHRDSMGDKRLVAYVVPAAEVHPGVEDLRRHMKGVLPDYMIPSAVVVVDAFPLTPNGKLDRAALPLPNLSAYTTRSYRAPEGDIETTVARVWQELLQLERVGRDDDFFDMGGHSLLAMQTIVRLSAAMSIDLPIRLMFEYPILKEIAAELAARRQARLIEVLAEGGNDVQDLIERVASMSEHAVQQLIGELQNGAWQ